MRGISLDEIVATTKIGRRLLQALEDEQFDLLPGGIFNKAYVRAYAKCIGMNEEDAVAEYLEASNDVAPDPRRIAQQHASIHASQPASRSRFPVLPVLILLVVAAGGIGGWKIYLQHESEREKQKAAADTGIPSKQSPPQAAEAPAANKPVSRTAPVMPQDGRASAPQSAAPSKPASSNVTQPAVTPVRDQGTSATEPAGTPFELTVRAKDNAWVSIKADGKYVVRGIIRPPEVKTIKAVDQVIFYTGNAGAIEMSFNGKDVPVMGGPNQEQVLVFNSHGLQPAAASRAAAQ